MIPIALDPARIMLGLAGRGAALRRRLATLRAGNARQLILFSDEAWFSEDAGCCHDSHSESATEHGVILHPRLPQPTDLASLDVLWIAGLPQAVAAPLAAAARSHDLLVNVEDQPELCDFHSVAEIRRGDLLLTVSTGGRSPRLAARIRTQLERQFDPAWATRIGELASLRQRWRGEKNSMAEVSALTDAVLASAGWLP
jgi:precorrin-2 dehydrogenase / sirohydrochlorin ferrochelatase